MGLQSDVYVGELEHNGAQLQSPHRVTLDERNDFPSAWLPGDRGILFYSDRNGNWDIFQQRIDQTVAQEFVLGPDEQREPRLAPDGAAVLYWKYTTGSQPPAASGIHLLRVPIAGGAPQPVLDASAGAQFRCPSQPGRDCILSEEKNGRRQLIFTAFETVRGRKGEVAKMEHETTASPQWDLSPDGTKLALVGLEDQKNHIRIVDLGSSSTRELIVPLISAQLLDIAWTRDGTGFFVSTSSARESLLLHITLKGQVHELWKGHSPLSTPVPSPDGKHLAFAISSQNSNAWMLEFF